MLSLVVEQLPSVEWGTSRATQPDEPPRADGPVAVLEWMLATMNAEALRSITALYFGHGICCHVLARVWNQDPTAIIARIGRGYGVRDFVPTHGEPWKLATDAELDALAATIDLAKLDAATRFSLFSFAPRLYPVSVDLWSRVDSLLST